MRIALTAALVLALGACAGSGGPRTPVERLERALAGTAQPSEVIASDLAFARTAREEGQWTAFREFAAPGAVMHLAAGPVDAAGWLQGRADPAETVRWTPRAVWMSCDGEMAVSTGIYQDPNGTIGTYVTAWKIKRDRTYEWVYDTGAPDDPQPSPPAEGDVPEDAIIVTALNTIQGNVADCQKRGETVPSPRLPIPEDEVQFQSFISSDETLRWGYRHQPDGARSVSVDWFKDGEWRQAFAFEMHGSGG